MLWRTSFTTDLSELDVVMGQGERKLWKAIREIVETHAPPAVFVYATCVTALIGDDIDAVCKHATEKFATPVIPVHSAGFHGSKNLGNKLAGEALIEHVIGTHEPDDVGPHDINILGEFNLAGEFWLVKPLLDELGIRVRACIPGDARYLDVASAHRARATMMVCSTALINLARKMEERWGIPFFEGSFYGIADTSQALREIVAGKYKGTKFNCSFTGSTPSGKVGMTLDGGCRVGVFTQKMSATVQHSGNKGYRGTFLDGADGKGLDIVSGNVVDARKVVFALNRNQLKGVMQARIPDDNTMNVTVSVRVDEELVPVIGMSLKRVDSGTVGAIARK